MKKIFTMLAAYFFITAFTFIGGTGQELVEFIQLNGSGVYDITGQVTINSPITLSTKAVTIKGATTSLENPLFLVGTTGSAITINANNIELDHVSISASDPSIYTGTLLLVKSNQARIVDCSFNAGNGTAINTSGSFATYIKGPHIELSENYGIGINITGHTIGLTIIGEGYGRGIYNGNIAIYMDECEGIYIEKLMSYKTKFGLFMNPKYDDAIINIVLESVNFDSTHSYGEPVRSWNGHGNYKITRLFFNSCWMYSGDTGGYVYEFDNPIDTISIIGGYAKSANPNFPDTVKFNSTVVNSIIKHVQD